MRRINRIDALLAYGASLLGAITVVIRCQAAEADTSFRVGFTSNLFTDINENDAKAAVRGWAQTVAKQRNIPTDPEPSIFNGVPALLDALQVGRVDALGINILDYAALRRSIRFDPIFVTYVARRQTEQYLLLTHRDSGINGLADLRGRNVSLQHYARACLAQPWLDTLLVQNGFRPVAEFAGKISFNPKLSKTILPVFFRQVEACVATRSGFATMIELNPQLGKQLKILAASPELVPVVFCFRADYAPRFREPLLAGMRELHQTPVGQQVLTIFQTEKIEEQPASFLNSTLELIETYEELCRPRSGATTSTPPQIATRPAKMNESALPAVSTVTKSGSL
jgi:ABC-type phosphate/phosphonate transport system substrate-binding protein